MSDSDVLEIRPTKCTRLSIDDPNGSQAGSSSTSSSFNLHRHPEIWFDDGNIVLVAQGTAFHIYRGLLAGQSTVFGDMFASSSAIPDETFDGCPIVHLSDSPHDLVHLLLNPIHTFDKLAAVIRLAHKYNVPQVQDQALVSLEECGFATPFTAFSRLSPKPHITLKPAHSISVINLAHLTDTPSLLPVAFYDCAHHGSALLDSWTHEDSTVEHLSDADLHRCIDTHVVLADERTLFLCHLFDDTPSAGCERPDSCIAELRRLHRNTMCPEVLLC